MPTPACVPASVARSEQSGCKNGFGMVTRIVLSLHDQATELRYPEGLQATIDLMFGGQAGNLSRRGGRTISIEETGADRYRLKGGSKDRLDDLTLPELLDTLLDEVVHSLIDKLDSAVALHAASVGWGAASVLIAGQTGAGKTSLAGWLVAKGFEFLSDELVVVTDQRGTTASFPRPLLAKPGTQELIAILAQSGHPQTLATAGNTVICLERPSAAAERSRQAGLIIFPHYVAGSELELTSSTPAMTGMRLMECNLNARNLAGHGFPTLSAFARNVPALILTYGTFAQLDCVLDRLAKFILEGGIDPAGLRKFVAAFRPQGQAMSVPAAASPARKFPVPAPTPRQSARKLTIGMATYDDFDGVYFTLQALRLYHPEILADTELLVVDNHPDGPCAQHLKNLENAIPGYRYVPKGEISGTAVRDWIFQEAGGDFVLCMDCHVFVVPGALKRLIDYLDARPDTRDLLQGPLLYDDLRTISTHFRPEWRSGMYGVWDKSPAAADVDAAPFDIPMQGLGLFACRRAAWRGFNPEFRGFGGVQGDPAAALLEVLDPAQNDSFTDHYLGIPFDLSEVLFIATANFIQNIPAPLLDRMEVVEFSGYIEAEKVAIAEQYLVPRQVKETASLTNRSGFTGPALLELVQRYTRESGVRQLEREIGRVARKAARRIASGTGERVEVTTTLVRDLLGRPKLHPEVKAAGDLVGTATGMYYTPMGGDIMFVEGSTMRGKGELVLTGQLGDVMKESARAAWTYARAHAAALHIKDEMFDRDVHLHVPAGRHPEGRPQRRYHHGHRAGLGTVGTRSAPRYRHDG